MKVSHLHKLEDGYRRLSQISDFPVQMFAEGHCNTNHYSSTICRTLSILKSGLKFTLNIQ
jgi:hypothetical protein